MSQEFKAYKVNGLWCLVDQRGDLVCTLIGMAQPKSKEQAFRFLLQRKGVNK